MQNNNVFVDPAIFGEFDESGVINGVIFLVRIKLKQNNSFFKLIRTDIHFDRVKTDINPEIFGDFDDISLANAFDEIVSITLKQYLITFYKSKKIEPFIFGDFGEQDLANGISQLIDMRLAESLSYWEYQNRQEKQTTYNSNNANQYVYILYNEILYQEYNTHIYKIGWTSRIPQIRADEISQGTGVVGKWKVGHQWKVEDGYWLEQEIFRHFAQYRLPYSEQFNFKGQTLEQVAEQISRFINNHGESPKRAAEIAAKELAERKQKKKLEEEQQRVKYTYDAECNKIKIEIQNIQHSNLEKALKNDSELKKSFFESIFWWAALGGFIGIFAIDYIIGLIVFGAIVGYIFYFLEKDTKYHELKKKYLPHLPDDLEQLKKIRDNIISK